MWMGPMTCCAPAFTVTRAITKLDETHKTSPDFDQTAADKAKNRIKQALGEIGCDVFIETDR